MRTITHSEFQAASGEPVYVSTVHYASRAEREAGDAAVQRVVVPAAFTPFGMAGEPMDPPEEPWPSDRTAREYAPEPVSASYTTGAVPGGIRTAGEGAYNPPPNCDFVSHGEALAHAQHRAAEGGEGCDSVACSITQGAND